MKSDYLTTKQVAQEIGVHRDTLLRWLRNGKVPEPRRNAKGYRMFVESDLRNLRGLVEGWNDPVITVPKSIQAVAKRLEKLDWDFRDSKTGYLTHSIHPYPAKFIPQIPNQLIQELSSLGDSVLDPFCGSGTTLLEALLLRRNAIGIDANPLACQLSKAKTARLSDNEFLELESLLNDTRQFMEALRAGQHTLFADIQIPFSADNSGLEKDDLDFWFAPIVQKELSWLKFKIGDLSSSKLQEVAATSFSAIIVAVSHQDSDTRYTRRDKKIETGETLSRFADHLARQIPHLRELAEQIQPELSCEVICSDVLKTPSLPRVNLIVTSPPYPNAYSYHLYHRTRMLWLGMDQPQFKKDEIGSHRKYSSKSKTAATVETFRAELEVILNWLKDHLVDNGYICFLLGDSKIRGEIIRNDILFIEVAKKLGLTLVANIERSLQSSKKSFNPSIARIRKEYVIVLTKEGKGYAHE